MFALMAWTSLIIHLGNVTASISGKSGHAFIVYRGPEKFKPFSLGEKAVLSMRESRSFSAPLQKRLPAGC